MASKKTCSFIVPLLHKSSLLLLTDWFTPGYRAGGPIQSARNFALAMQSHYAIWVLTSDHDLDAPAPYSGLAADRWLDFPDSDFKVCYTAARQRSAWRMLRYIWQVKPSHLYLNSLFSWYFSLLPLLFFRLGLVRTQIVLAPRGMLKASALQFKARKKQVFLQVFRWSGLPRRIVFHATDEQEKNDIQRAFGPNCRIQVIPSFPAAVVQRAQPKVKNAVTRLVFVGRVHPIKNLDFALRCLASCTQELAFYVVGSAEDPAYLALCQGIAQRLPPCVQVFWVGELPHHQLSQTLYQYDFLWLPTQGENFGHAIFECLAAGLPVIISDQTPWQNLEAQQVGWSLPLSDPEAFSRAIQAAASMPADQYSQWSAAAQQYAQHFIQEAGLVSAYQKLFS